MKKSKTLTKSMNHCSWADLDPDLLGEIKKKLIWADHARFSAVCKTWLAAEHAKRAGDVLPWCLLLYREKLDRITYRLYEPLNLDQPLITQTIHLDEFFDPSTIQMAAPLVYLHGCLLFSLHHIDHTSTNFLLVSIPTRRTIKLPQFHHPSASNSDFLKAVSTYPYSPDCVFLALHVANSQRWTVGIFRHGDTQWTTTEFNLGEIFSLQRSQGAVFIRGVFYILCYNQKLASYDIASGELKFDSFQFPTDCRKNCHLLKFFALNGELMILYHHSKVRKYILTSYDWSHKRWVRLKSLGDTSLFISDCSVYADSINYYGVSSNKIYYQQNGTCRVYSFKNGELLKSTSSGLRNWDGLDYSGSRSVWVEPPDLLLK